MQLLLIFLVATVNFQAHPLAAFANAKPIESSPLGNNAHIIYVATAHPMAADTNPGSADLPLKTIAKSLETATQYRRQGMATQVLIGAGVYREQLVLQADKNPQAAAIVISAITPNSVIISGSDIWQNWQLAGAGLYAHDWLFDWGFSGNPWTEYEIDFPPIAQRGEMVFANNQLLQQILQFAALKPNSFYVDEQQNKIYLRLANDNDPNQHQIEVATRKTVLALNQISNITIKDIIFQHSAGTFNAAFTISNSTNILVENCQFNWNNWAGMSAGNSDRIFVHKSSTSFNGLKGGFMSYVNDLEFIDHETSHNNWRGAWGKFYDWDAGEKFAFINHGKFENYRAIANFAAGLWLDTDNRDIVIDHAFLANNAVTGLFLEAGPGPITVKNSIIYNNYQIAPNYLQTPGLFAWSAANVTVENNLIFGNQFAQVGVRDLYPRQVEGKPNQTGTLVSKNWVFRNNVVLATDPAQKLLVTLKAKPFLDSLRSNNNIWSVSGSINPSEQGLEQADLPFQLDQRRLNFQQWQVETGQDQDSIWLSSQDSTPSQGVD